MRRVIFTCLKGWQYRRQLQHVLLAPVTRCRTVCDLTAIGLCAQGVIHLVLDFDGVLAEHGALRPRPEVEAWLDDFCRTWPQKQISIFSNKPLPARAQYFQSRYPQIRFISGVAKKPYPAGLLALIKAEGIAPETVLLVDDRLLTGALAAIQAGVQVMYVEAPFRGQIYPVHEGFFQGLRQLERGLYYSRPPRDPR